MEDAGSGRRASTQPASLRRSWTSSALNLQRRQSSSDRVNEILENARERAQVMENDATSLATRARHSRGGNPSTTADDESADELTRMVGPKPGQSYQATQTDSNGPRTRRSQPDAPTAPAREAQAASSDDETEGQSPWWKRSVSKFRSIELENKGSVARDHLALERTFLAWLRTSLAFASIGVAVTQLFRLNTSLRDADPASGPESAHADLGTLRQMGRPLGTTFLGASVVTLLLGYKRYFDSQQWIMKGKFPASRGTITVTALMAFAIIVLSMVVVIVLHPSSTSSG